MQGDWHSSSPPLFRSGCNLSALSSSGRASSDRTDRASFKSKATSTMKRVHVRDDSPNGDDDATEPSSVTCFDSVDNDAVLRMQPNAPRGNLSFVILISLAPTTKTGNRIRLVDMCFYIILH